MTLILLHIVIITLLNKTQRQDGTSTPFNLICFLGTEWRKSARERREDELVFGFNVFLDISLSEMACSSPFHLSKSTFRRMIIWPRATLCSRGISIGSELL